MGDPNAPLAVLRLHWRDCLSDQQCYLYLLVCMDLQPSKISSFFPIQVQPQVALTGFGPMIVREVYLRLLWTPSLEGMVENPQWPRLTAGQPTIVNETHWRLTSIKVQPKAQTSVALVGVRFVMSSGEAHRREDMSLDLGASPKISLDTGARRKSPILGLPSSSTKTLLAFRFPWINAGESMWRYSNPSAMPSAYIATLVHMSK